MAFIETNSTATFSKHPTDSNQLGASGTLNTRKISRLIPVGIGAGAVAALITAIVLVVLKQSMIFSGVFFLLSGGLTFAEILVLMANRNKNAPFQPSGPTPKHMRYQAKTTKPKEITPKPQPSLKIEAITDDEGLEAIHGSSPNFQQIRVEILNKISTNWENVKRSNPSMTIRNNLGVASALGFVGEKNLLASFTKILKIDPPMDGNYTNTWVERFITAMRQKFQEEPTLIISNPGSNSSKPPLMDLSKAYLEQCVPDEIAIELFEDVIGDEQKKKNAIEKIAKKVQSNWDKANTKVILNVDLLKLLQLLGFEAVIQHCRKKQLKQDVEMNFAMTILNAIYEWNNGRTPLTDTFWTLFFNRNKEVSLGESNPIQETTPVKSDKEEEKKQKNTSLPSNSNSIQVNPTPMPLERRPFTLNFVPDQIPSKHAMDAREETSDVKLREEARLAILKIVSTNWEKAKQSDPNRQDWNLQELADTLGFPAIFILSNGAILRKFLTALKEEIPKDGVFTKERIEMFIKNLRQKYQP